MIPYILELEEVDGTKKHCFVCGVFFTKGYCYNQITFPNNKEIEYKYSQIRGKIYSCEECRVKEDETKVIHNELERWAKVQVGFPEYSSELVKNDEEKDNIDNVPKQV